MIKARSVSANKAYYGWFPAIADMLAVTTKEATRIVKLEFGVPILLADNYLGHLFGPGMERMGFFQMSEAQQLIEMDRLPLTRVFTTAMHK